MQSTRRHILEILRSRGQATVEDIVEDLQARRGALTAVTVRHHLLRLQQEQLITSPELRRRSTPGRPQHVYALTEKAQDTFRNNYQRLAASLLSQLQKTLPPAGVNVILEGVAEHFAGELSAPDAELDDIALVDRLEVVVDYLNQQGYDARWEACEGGYTLHTSNCPYHQIAQETGALCAMDMHLMSRLLGMVPRRVHHMLEGDNSCAYFVPKPQR
jgi:predicted ArsR family transcriptional regulator